MQQEYLKRSLVTVTLWPACWFPIGKVVHDLARIADKGIATCCLGMSRVCREFATMNLI